VILSTFSSACRLVLNAIESAQRAVHVLFKPLAYARIVINVPARKLPKPLLGFNVVHTYCTFLTNLIIRRPLFLDAGQS
jgi:hypothetical protein